MIRAMIHDDRGAMTVEVAIIAPVLAMLSIGGFEASTMIARQTELQSAAAEAAAIVRASVPEDWADRQVVKGIIATSTGLTANDVSVTEVYRCGINTSYVANRGDCSNGNTRTEYIRVRLQDSHSPIWNEFGVGSAVNYDVSRTVQIG